MWYFLSVGNWKLLQTYCVTSGVMRYAGIVICTEREAASSVEEGGGAETGPAPPSSTCAFPRRACCAGQAPSPCAQTTKLGTSRGSGRSWGSQVTRGWRMLTSQWPGTMLVLMETSSTSCRRSREEGCGSGYELQVQWVEEGEGRSPGMVLTETSYTSCGNGNKVVMI